MKKSKLPRIPLLSSISLLLFIAVIVFWVRSWHHGDILGFYTPDGHLQAVANDRQGVLLFLSDVPFGREMGLSADAMTSTSDAFKEIHEFLFDPANAKWKFLGLRLANGTFGTWSWKFNALIVPYWILLIPLAILPTTMFRRGMVWIQRRRRGQCLTCGYDLRHSAERCPECGEAILSTKGHEGTLRNAKTDEAGGRSSRMAISRFFSLALAAALVGSVLSLFRAGHQAHAMTAWQAEETAGLHRRIGEFAAHGTLEEAIETLRKQTGAQIEVSWPRNQTFGFNRKSPVDVHLYDVDVETVLASLIRQAGANAFAAWFAGYGHKIIIAEPQMLPRFVRVYPLADIPAKPDIASPGGCLFGPAPPPTTSQKYEGLDAAVADAVRSDSWVANGGSGGDIRLWADRLVVVQTLDGHADVQEMLKALRQNAGSADLPQEAANPHANLDQPIAELNLKDATLESAMETLRQKTKANIVVNWTSRSDDAEIHRHTPVRLHAWHVTLGQALSLISRSVKEEERPSFGVDGNVITVAAGLIEDRVRMYDVRDLVADAMNFAAAHFVPNPSPQGVGNQLFRGGAVDPADDASDGVVQLLEGAVDPQSWKVNGGNAAYAHAWCGRLFIHQTSANHLKIAAALSLLRTGGSKDGSAASDAASIAEEVPATKAPLIRYCDTPSDTTQPAVDHAFLGRPIDDVKFDCTLEQALNSLGEKTKSNLVVYWDDFAEAGIRRDAPIKVHLWDLTLGHTIEAVLLLAGGDGSITCGVRGETIEVGSTSRLQVAGRISTRLYDVRDIIDGVIAYSKLHPPAPQRDGLSPRASSSPTPAYQGMSADEAVESLVKVFEDDVATDSWKDNGGSAGSIREFSGRLLITQTLGAHHRIVEILRAIRAGGDKEGMDIHRALPTTRAVK